MNENFKSQIENIKQWNPEIGEIFDNFLSYAQNHVHNENHLREQFANMVETTSRFYNLGNKDTKILDKLYKDLTEYYD